MTHAREIARGATLTGIAVGAIDALASWRRQSVSVPPPENTGTAAECAAWAKVGRHFGASWLPLAPCRIAV
jgi:hypothetical protein